MVQTRNGNKSSGKTETKRRSSATDLKTAKKRLSHTPKRNDSPADVLNFYPLSGPTDEKKVTRSSFRVRKVTTTGRIPFDQTTTIANLDDSQLLEIFIKLSKMEEYGPNNCREVLPLVCKRWCIILRQPSPVWKSLEIDFEDKGSKLVPSPEEKQWQVRVSPRLKTLQGGNSALASNNNAERGHYRILHSAIERWMSERFGCFKNLTLRNAKLDQTHSFPTQGHGLRKLFNMLGPGLMRLKIVNCQSIFTGASIKDMAMLSELKVLKLDQITTQVTGSQLAALQAMINLQELVLRFDPDVEETAGFVRLSGFPKEICELKSLRRLTIQSKGIDYIPGCLSKLVKLKILDVSGCPVARYFADSRVNETVLEDLQRALGGVTHVIMNNIRSTVWVDNTFKNLFNAMSVVKSIKTLEFKNNGMVRLPELDKWWRTVTRLELCGNPMTGMNAWANLEHMPHLEHLEASSTQTSHISATVLQDSFLTYLDLSNNLLVDFLADRDPDDKSLIRLKELNLSNNPFPSIPEGLGEIEYMKRLDMTGCTYLEVSKSIANLANEGFENLEWFDLRKAPAPYQESTKKWLTEFASIMAAPRLDNYTYCGDKEVPCSKALVLF